MSPAKQEGGTSNLSNNYVQLEDIASRDEAPNTTATNRDIASATITHKENGASNELTQLVPAQEKEKRSSGRGKFVFCVLLVAFVASGCGFSIPAPFFPREAADRNVSSSVIGFVFGCYQIVNFVSSPIYGHFVPDLGARAVCFTGLIVAGTSTILFGLLDKTSSKTLFLVFAFTLRILEGLGMSAFTTSLLTIACVEFEEKVAAMYAILEGGFGVGMMVGPTLGGALFEAGGFGLPFWILGSLIVTTGMLLLVVLPRDVDQVPSALPRTNVLKLLTSPLVWVSMLLLFDGTCSAVALEPTLALHLRQFDLTPFQISLFFVITPLCQVLLAPIWGYLSDKKAMQAPLMLTTCVMSALGFLLLGPTPLLPGLPRAIWLNVLALVLFGLMYNCTFVTTMKGMMNGATELGLPESLNTYSLVAGLFHFVLYFGAFVGPTVAGTLVDAIGFEYTTSVFAALFLVTLLVIAIFFGYRWLQRSGGKM